MRKGLSLILAIVFLLFAFALSEDYSGYTLMELIEMRDAIQKEIDSRNDEVMYTYEWYKKGDTKTEGETFLLVKPVENPVPIVERGMFDSGYGWMYSFRIELTDGNSFTPTKVVQNMFTDRENVSHMEFTGDGVKDIFSTDILWAGYTTIFNGGLPIQDVHGVGLSVEGLDENGNTVVFRAYAEFSHELP